MSSHILKPVLIYVTHGFPCNEQDVFSYDEYAFLQEVDAELYVLPRLGQPCPVHIPNTEFPLLPKRRSRLAAALKLEGWNLLCREFFTARGHSAPCNLNTAFRAAGIALQARDAVRDIILQKNLQERPIVIYAFWFSEAVYGISLLKKEFPQVRIVTRAHGGDLYAAACKNGYLPFRFLRSHYVDIAAPCSQCGVDVLRRDGFSSEQLHKSFLGVPSQKHEAKASPQGEIHLISVSFVSPVKRLLLLVSSLRALAEARPQLRIHWHHVGNGPQEEALRMQAEAEIANLPNLTYALHGYLPVHEIRRLLAETSPLDALINVSESEGIPVSMMEATAAGLPILGTDVGGVREIITARTGICIPKNFSKECFTAAVDQLQLWKNPAKRRDIVEFHAQNFNSETNYRKFVYGVLRKEIEKSMRHSMRI